MARSSLSSLTRCPSLPSLSLIPRSTSMTLTWTTSCLSRCLRTESPSKPSGTKTMRACSPSRLNTPNWATPRARRKRKRKISLKVLPQLLKRPKVRLSPLSRKARSKMTSALRKKSSRVRRSRLSSSPPITVSRDRTLSSSKRERRPFLVFRYHTSTLWVGSQVSRMTTAMRPLTIRRTP